MSVCARTGAPTRSVAAAEHPHRKPNSAVHHQEHIYRQLSIPIEPDERGSISRVRNEGATRAE